VLSTQRGGGALGRLLTYDHGMSKKSNADSKKAPPPRRRRWRLVVAFVIVAHVSGFVSSIHAVMSTRTSQGAIAWAVSLNAFPYVAVPAYWVLGRNKFQGYVTARRQLEQVTDEVVDDALARIQPFLLPEAVRSEAGRAAERLAELPFLTGNHSELLIDGEATFASILEGIDAAEDYILFQFYIVKDDEIGRELQQHLIAKARQGVRVYFLYDEIGSHELSRDYMMEMREVDIEVFAFNTRQGPGNRFQLNFRNHRKVVVADGKVAWIGGHNVGDEYLGRDPDFPNWRDTHARIEGPAALGAQLSFVEDWHWATGQIPELWWTPVKALGSDEPVLIVPSGPADELETAALMFLHAINSARERIWIATPYFVPDEAVVAALQLAGLRGVDVRILIPDKPDLLPVYLAAFSYFDEAGSTGAKFYRYTDGFLHEKVMLIDSAAATIGTANFDNRSFRLNFEITAVFADPGFIAQVEQMFLDDFEHSAPIGPGEYTDRPFWFRFAVKVARLASPIL